MALLTFTSCKTGEIMLSLILFGKDVSSGPRLQRWIPEEKHLPIGSPRHDDSASLISPTSSMDLSDFSTEVSSLPDLPGSPSLRVFYYYYYYYFPPPSNYIQVDRFISCRQGFRWCISM